MDQIQQEKRALRKMFAKQMRVLNEKQMKDEEATKQKSLNGGPGTTEEKAQYQVFTNGDLPRATLDKWIRTDIESAMSVLHAIRTDETIFTAVADAFEKRYRKLHEELKTEKDGGK